MVTFLGSVSNPVTLCPASAKRSASGKPTYPQPMIATLSCAPLKNSGFRSMAICYFLLLVILPRAAWSQRNRVFGDPASPAALLLGQSQQDTRLMQQRQGTSLFILLPPIGLGALREYWKEGQVDLRAGILCALGILLGAYGGSSLALPMPSRNLQGLFGSFLVLSAILLWRKAQIESRAV